MTAGERVDTLHLFAPLRRALAELLQSLDESQWALPTACPGWTVKDIALHVLGVELGNISYRRDDHAVTSSPDTSLGEWLAGFNEQWVAASRRISTPLLIDLLDSAGAKLEAHLATLDLDIVDAHVSWAGSDAVPRWLDVAREYTERWVHQQQIRDATNRPGMIDATYAGPVIATFVHALPVAFAAADKPDGTSVVVEIHGAGGGAWSVVRTGTRWRLQQGAHDHPTARVTTTVDNAWRLLTRNAAARPPTITGDESLGRPVQEAVAIIV
jgi:uncharacterized protein (TIGR03083 family)